MLPRNNRISKKDFPSSQRQGFRVFSPFFSAVFYQTTAKTSRVAVVVSKKTAKTAVERNTLRRRFYDLVGLYFKNVSAPTTVVLYPKIDAKKTHFLTIKSEIEKAFKQAKLIK